jgi:hypothetical protein
VRGSSVGERIAAGVGLAIGVVAASNPGPESGLFGRMSVTGMENIRRPVFLLWVPVRCHGLLPPPKSVRPFLIERKITQSQFVEVSACQDCYTTLSRYQLWAARIPKLVRIAVYRDSSSDMCTYYGPDGQRS